MKKALVIGYGISGQGAEKLLHRLGYRVEILDDARIPISTEKWDLGKEFELAVLSPGIPMDHPEVVKVSQKNVEIISEVELGLRFIENVCIGITGTNGKTTLTQFLAHVLKGKALGNIGKSVSSYACSPNKEDILVIELSSFQLETIKIRRLDYAVITNISHDHLDRYPSFEAYARAKYRIGDCLKEKGICFVPSGLEKQLRCPVQVIDKDSYLQLTLEKGYWKKLDTISLFLAFAVCQKFGVRERDFLRALKTFQKPLHRLESVDVIKGVAFINDSKSTNPAATLYAVQEIETTICLIVGGISKASEFEAWKNGFGKRVKAVFIIGEASTRLKKILDPFYDIYEKKSLHEAVLHAYQIALGMGATVLLSPGCASFDQFDHYRHRGETFKKSVQQLRRGI